jgi:hypothetical protein
MARPYMGSYLIAGFDWFLIDDRVRARQREEFQSYHGLRPVADRHDVPRRAQHIHGLDASLLWLRHFRYPSPVPTHDEEPRWWNDFHKLMPSQRALFKAAVREFIAVLETWEAAGRPGILQFPRHLGVKHMTNRPNVMEFAWDSDGRCTWHYGLPVEPDKVHVVWRRIGTHQIFNDP